MISRLKTIKLLLEKKIRTLILENNYNLYSINKPHKNDKPFYTYKETFTQKKNNNYKNYNFHTMIQTCE